MSISTTFTSVKSKGAIANATLNVLGEDGVQLPDPESILGMKPDSRYRIGESKRGERPSPRDAWFFTESQALSEGEDFPGAVEQCLIRLMARLRSKDVGNRLRASGLTGRASITVHGFCEDFRDTSLSFTADILRDLAEFGLPLEEDFYESS